MKTTVQGLDGWGRTGRFIHRFRFTCIGILLLFAVSLGIFAPKLPSVLGGDGFKTAGDYQRARSILEEDFKQSQDTLLLVFRRKAGTGQPEYKQRVAEMIQRIQKTEPYAAFRHPLQNPAMMKEDIAYAAILLKGDTMKELEKRTLAFAKRAEMMSDDAVDVSPTGFTVINDEINKRSQSDLKKAEMIGLPIAFLVLLLSFGSLTASILPIINGALSVGATMGVLYFLGREKELSIFVLNVAPMIGLALSIDFALLFVNRFREELSRRSVEDAVAVTYQTAGRAILFSGLCVFVGLSGLFFFRIDYIQSVAISGMIVVLLSMLFSLTMLPAALSLTGRRLLGRGSGTGHVFWRRFAASVMRYPVAITGMVLVLIAVCLLPLRDADLKFPGIESLPEESKARIAYEQYEAEFNRLAKTNADATVIVEANQAMTEADTLRKLEELARRLARDKSVKQVTSVFSMAGMSSTELSLLLESPQRDLVQPAFTAYTHGKRALLQLYLQEKPKSGAAKQWVRDFKAAYDMEGFSYTLGGVTTFEQELEDEIRRNIGISMSVILGSTFFILLAAFRSLLIPLKAILMNLLSLSATIGLIVWLFQGGRFGLEQSTVMLVLPVFIFGLVFGLSMDYEVFLISRMYELYQETRDNDYATLEGLVSTSRIITSAALIMIVVTGAFAFTDILPVQQMGLGVALAILLDATVIRLLLVPSLMKLFGDWNWWLFNRRSAAKHQPRYE
ncbi:MMPL family transporter [Ectobacillus ponti]|uniref:MMPL family transporter n=1 Tax=Ectobacillus ponti TaxID=2961894 RepID=A0AA42BSI3_9BACI|nr:MMPL family transporter [Ectobacillus ponti]